MIGPNASRRETCYSIGDLIPFPIADFGLQIAAHGVTMSDNGNDNAELPIGFGMTSSPRERESPVRTARPRPPARTLARDVLLALYPLALVMLTLTALLDPPRVGAAALAQVLVHFLFLPALLLVPLALLGGMVLLRFALAAAAATFLLVYPPALNLAVPATAGSAELSVLSWNIYVGGVSPEQLRAALAEYQPDVVMLQEARWRMFADDAELAASYPYQLLRPEEAAPGMVILSRFPILESGVPSLDSDHWDMPRMLWARLDLGDRTVTVVNAHPIAPRIGGAGCRLAACYNTGWRDRQISDVRAVIDALRRPAEPLIVAGDMNVTEREPAYRELARGMQDAHRVAGRGFGASWRPGFVEAPFGLIRIDYIFTNEQARPVALHTDCANRGSDHCLLVGRIGLG